MGKRRYFEEYFLRQQGKDMFQKLVLPEDCHCSQRNLTRGVILER